MSTTLQALADQVFDQFSTLITGHAAGRFPVLSRRTPFAVAWTGGKDSTVLLHLWKLYLAELPEERRPELVALNIDTGCKFPEVIAFRDRLIEEWGLRCIVVRPEVALEGYPLAVDVTACCAALKIAPLARALAEHEVGVLFCGLRRDEHPGRAERKWLEEREQPHHWQCNPLLDWTELDVWAWIMDQGLPYCELYDQGYRSLGCRPCTAAPGSESGQGERGGRDQRKEAQLDALRSLGYF